MSSFFENTRKPADSGGRRMTALMNHGYAAIRAERCRVLWAEVSALPFAENSFSLVTARKETL